MTRVVPTNVKDIIEDPNLSDGRKANLLAAKAWAYDPASPRKALVLAQLSTTYAILSTRRI